MSYILKEILYLRWKDLTDLSDKTLGVCKDCGSSDISWDPSSQGWHECNRCGSLNVRRG